MKALKHLIACLVAALPVAAGPAAAAGLPQLDPTRFAPQIIWLVITFAVLYGLMARLALPRISEVLEERQDRIDDSLTRAGELQAEAEAAAAAFEASLTAARNRAHQVVVDAGHGLGEEAAQRQAELTDTLGAEIGTAEARIDAARDQALANIAEVAQDVARQAAEALGGEPVEEAAAAAAVDGVVRERG